MSLTFFRHNLEEVIIGACILDNSAFHRVMDTLSPKSFKGETIIELSSSRRVSHSDVWQGIQEVYKNKPIDLITLTSFLGSRYGEYRQFLLALTDITLRVCDTINIHSYALILIQIAIQQEAIDRIKSYVVNEGNTNRDLQGLIEQIKDKPEDILQNLEVAISFLQDTGYNELSDQLQLLLSQTAVKIVEMRKMERFNHVKTQYEIIKNGRQCKPIRIQEQLNTLPKQKVKLPV